MGAVPTENPRAVAERAEKKVMALMKNISDGVLMREARIAELVADANIVGQDLAASKQEVSNLTSCLKEAKASLPDMSELERSRLEVIRLTTSMTAQSRSIAALRSKVESANEAAAEGIASGRKYLAAQEKLLVSQSDNLKLVQELELATAGQHAGQDEVGALRALLAEKDLAHSKELGAVHLELDAETDDKRRVSDQSVNDILDLVEGIRSFGAMMGWVLHEMSSFNKYVGLIQRMPTDYVSIDLKEGLKHFVDTGEINMLVTAKLHSVKETVKTYPQADSEPVALPAAVMACDILSRAEAHHWVPVIRGQAKKGAGSGKGASSSIQID